MIEPLTLELLHQSARRDSPFLPEVLGFNEDWWVRSWRESGGSHGDALSIRRSGAEVARAMLMPHGPAATHIGAERLVQPVELTRFEVAEHARSRGLGRSAIDLISAYYMGQDLWAHSDADGFYERAGWRKHLRADGDASHASFFTRVAV